MLTPAAKRRRAETASATLSRPFRSPSVRGTTGGTATGNAPRSTQSSGRAPDSMLAGSPRRSSKRARQSGPSQSSPPLSTSTPSVPISLDRLVDQFSRELDAGDALLEQVHAATEAKAAKTEANTKTNTKTKSKDDMYDELPALIATWREAGRLAAEQVFEFVSQRIAGAGGIRAWRANAAPPPNDEDDRDDDRDRRHDNDDEDDCDDDEGDASRRERVLAEEEAREAHERAGAEQSQNFTMTTMLASLNVEPDLLGYDEAEERWAD